MPNLPLSPEDEAIACSLPSGRPRFASIAGNCTLVGWLVRGALVVMLFAGGMACGRLLGGTLYRLLH